MNYLIAILTVVAAYLIGSINFAVIFTKKFNNVDIRNFGSGNAGTTNVLRVSGAKAGAYTFLFDILKGVLAVLLGWFVFECYLFPGGRFVLPNVQHSFFVAHFNPAYGKFLCALACMLGHCFPIFFQFRGGKGVATSVGLFAVCCPPAIGLGLAGFAISLLIFKMVSLSSLIATIVVVAITIVCAFSGYFPYNANPFVISAIIIACGIMVFLRHKENIVRIVKGTEKKFSIKKEK